jgi:PadR family transcriptional regulator PadR
MPPDLSSGALGHRGQESHSSLKDAQSRRFPFVVLTFDTSRITHCCRGTTPMAKPSRLDLLQGTLDLLILRTLQPGDAMHGWAISERIRQLSDNVLQANQGSLYPALHRLEHQGWIKAEWGVSELGRRARFYRLTASVEGNCGRKQTTGRGWQAPSVKCWNWPEGKCHDRERSPFASARTVVPRAC